MKKIPLPNFIWETQRRPTDNRSAVIFPSAESPPVFNGGVRSVERRFNSYGEQPRLYTACLRRPVSFQRLFCSVIKH